MRRPRRPFFLERALYRRRRLTDAARLLPMLGLVLFLAPLAWAPKAVAGGLYLFVAWALLIFASWLVARALAAPEPGPPDSGLEEKEPPAR